MIGTSTSIRHSRRAHYPAISICREDWTDLLLNDNGMDVRKNFHKLKVSPRVGDTLSSMDYFKRNNKTRYMFVAIR